MTIADRECHKGISHTLSLHIMVGLGLIGLLCPSILVLSMTVQIVSLCTDTANLIAECLIHRQIPTNQALHMDSIMFHWQKEVHRISHPEKTQIPPCCTFYLQNQ